MEVYFDDFKVTHIKSPIIQTEDFYGFGLSFNSYSRESSIENKYLYNQGASDKKFLTERVLDLGLAVDLSKDRTYDYVTGRWWQIDPKADKEGQESWSPYNYAFDNPIRYNDPYGDCIPCWTAALSAKYSALFSSLDSPKESLTRLATNKSTLAPSNIPGGGNNTPLENKNLGMISDAKASTDVIAKNTATVTNEVTKDGLAGAKAVGTALEVTGVGAPAGMVINTVAGGLDEARQVSFEGKSAGDAATGVVINGAIDATFGGLGTAAKSTVKGSGQAKEIHDKVVDGYSFGLSNLFQWVSDKIQGTQTQKKE